MNPEIAVSAKEAAEIRRQAEELYPGQGIGPSMSQFNKLRPQEMPQSASMCCRVARSKRYRKSHWVIILKSLGLRYPTSTESWQVNRERQRRAEEATLAELAGFNVADLPRLHGDGSELPHIKRQRVVLGWNYRTHSYRPVGLQVVYELI